MHTSSVIIIMHWVTQINTWRQIFFLLWLFSYYKAILPSFSLDHQKKGKENQYKSVLMAAAYHRLGLFISNILEKCATSMASFLFITLKIELWKWCWQVSLHLCKSYCVRWRFCLFSIDISWFLHKSFIEYFNWTQVCIFHINKIQNCVENNKTGWLKTGKKRLNRVRKGLGWNLRGVKSLWKKWIKSKRETAWNFLPRYTLSCITKLV